jgi:hypothetical protein
VNVEVFPGDVWGDCINKGAGQKERLDFRSHTRETMDVKVCQRQGKE